MRPAGNQISDYSRGMLWLVNAELASSVSNGGALGIISPLAGMEKNGNSSENLMFRIAKTRELTDRPFGISTPLDLEESGILVDALLKEEVQVVITKFV